MPLQFQWCLHISIGWSTYVSSSLRKVPQNQCFPTGQVLREPYCHAGCSAWQIRQWSGRLPGWKSEMSNVARGLFQQFFWRMSDFSHLVCASLMSFWPICSCIRAVTCVLFIEFACCDVRHFALEHKCKDKLSLFGTPVSVGIFFFFTWCKLESLKQLS